MANTTCPPRAGGRPGRRGDLRRPGGAFTLVELLVVVAIIALLLALLTPSLQRAKYLTRIVICKARLHDTGNAVNAYGTQNRGNLTRFDNAASSAVNMWDANLAFYDHLRSRYKLPHESFFCPLQRADLTDEKTGAWKACTGGGFYRLGYCVWIPFRSCYGVMPPSPGDGQGYVTPDDRPFAGPGRPDDPNVANPILSDVVFTYAPCGTPNADTDLSQQDLGLYTYSQHVNGPFLESINAAWLDGHVEWIAPRNVRPRFLSKNNYWDWR